MMPYKTRSGKGGEGWGLICHTDGTWQGEDTVHQSSYLSAHPCFPSPHWCACVYVCVCLGRSEIQENELEEWQGMMTLND